jgi:hypothetical protein
MPTSDGSRKLARGAWKTGDPPPADTGGASDTSPGEDGGPPGGVNKGRGPYRIAEVPMRDRDAEILGDPQAAAFAEALKRIGDPEQRALVAWLVQEFARQRKNSGPAAKSDTPTRERAGSKS